VIATIQMGIGVGGNSLMPTLVQDLAPAYLRGRLFALSTVITTIFQGAGRSRGVSRAEMRQPWPPPAVKPVRRMTVSA